MTKRFRKKYFDTMYDIIREKTILSVQAIEERLGLPRNFRMKPKKAELVLPVLFELYKGRDEQFNRENWSRLFQALKLPPYFESQIHSRSLKRRLAALKNVADLDTDLKEAVASRYLFAKDEKLRMSSRLHAARFGTSYPFKAIEDDSTQVFTQEYMVKLHRILQYRYDHQMQMPNFILWCNQTPVNEGLQIFAINEIRLFRLTEDCAELLTMLCNSHDEKVSCELIKTLGELEYAPAEEEFRRRYAYANVDERQALAEALGAIGSGNPEVVDFLVEDYRHASDNVTRVHLLRVLYNYGVMGRRAYEGLKMMARPDEEIYFEHIECKLIDSRKYA